MIRFVWRGFTIELTFLFAATVAFCLLTDESGVSVLALRSKVPLIPVYIAGKYRIGGKLRAIVGKPVDADDLRALRADKQTLDTLDQRIYQALVALQERAESC